MPKTRVLVVDDSVVVRRLIADAVGADAQFEVAGTAANGRIALAKIPQVNPDIVTLDIEMPEMDGLETLEAIRRTYPRLPVVMFSTLTERAAAATLKALTLGASDYVTKPSGGSLAASLAQVREQLLAKLRALSGRSLPREPAKAAASPARDAPPRPVPIAAAKAQVLAIGCSTGGPNALSAIFEALPPRLPVPTVIVQHMPPLFTRLLADRLRAHAGHNVREAQGGERLAAADVWIAPGDFHLVVRRDADGPKLAVHQGPPENSCRPAVDVLFRSVVEAYGGSTLAVVLTGMGQDGLRGCRLVRESGGQVVVQDEATSVVWGMPGYVAGEGLADAIVPLADMAAEISRRLGSSNARAVGGASCP